MIAGGPHVTVEFETVMKDGNIDYACRGEGEYVLRELVLNLQGMGPLPKTGLVYRRNGGLVVLDRALVGDLGELPWPDYSLVDLKAYINRPPKDFGPTRVPEIPGISYDLARGCPCACTFCQTGVMSGKKIRTRPPEDAVHELEMLRDTYGVRSVLFRDDNLFLKKKVAKKLLRTMIERKLGFSWAVSSLAIFAMDEEYLDLMAESGCRLINMAVESGSFRVVHELIKKPIMDLEEIPGWVEKFKRRGIYVVSNFILGYPGETWSEIIETINFAARCDFDYVRFFAATPLIGTPMYAYAIDNDYLRFPDDIDVDWRYSQIKSDEWTDQDIRILRTYEWDRINFSSPEKVAKTAAVLGISVEKLNAHRRQTRKQLVLSGGRMG